MENNEKYQPAPATSYETPGAHDGNSRIDELSIWTSPDHIQLLDSCGELRSDSLSSSSRSNQLGQGNTVFLLAGILKHERRKKHHYESTLFEYSKLFKHCKTRSVGAIGAKKYRGSDGFNGSFRLWLDFKKFNIYWVT